MSNAGILKRTNKKGLRHMCSNRSHISQTFLKIDLKILQRATDHFAVAIEPDLSGWTNDIVLFVTCVIEAQPNVALFAGINRRKVPLDVLWVVITDLFVASYYITVVIKQDSTAYIVLAVEVLNPIVSVFHIPDLKNARMLALKSGYN
jgi:hypothetical protein